MDQNRAPLIAEKTNKNATKYAAARVSRIVASEGDQGEKELIWTTRDRRDWEILIYRKESMWEACFFRWDIHHEHATASSFEAALRRAQQRIRSLEAGGLRAASWTGKIH